VVEEFMEQRDISILDDFSLDDRPEWYTREITILNKDYLDTVKNKERS